MLIRDRTISGDIEQPQITNFESPADKKALATKNVTMNVDVKSNESFSSKTNVVTNTSSPLFQRVFSAKSDESSKLLHTSPKVSSPKTVIDEQNEETELLTPNKTKTLTLKKKNSILAKRRKICLKTLEISDIQGHLFRRTKDKHGVTYWAKLYFVLVETALYGFRKKNSQKANCLIFLPGFTVSLAKEVHSKQHAYKVYHPKKTFYFAAESEQALSQWMEYIKRATLKGNNANMDPTHVDTVDTRELYSETDSSDDENESTANDGASPSSTTKCSFMNKGSSKKRGSIDDTSPSTTTKSEKYHLGFGSLKKFTNLHNLPFTSSSRLEKEKEREEKKKAQSDIPVPTAQFRSYRKIPGNAGMQLGSNTLLPVDYNMLTQRSMQSNQQLLLQMGSVAEQPTIKPPELMSNVKTSPKLENILSPPQCTTKPVIDSPDTSPNATLQTKQFEQHVASKPVSKLAKTKTLPFNYMHASNPNLVEFTFQTSKTLDVGLPKVNAANSFDPHQNLQGFITLKDLMLQREEDEAHNMYNNRVHLGIEKPSDRQPKRKFRRSNETSVTNEENENTTPNGQRTGFNKIQSRSLPKTPDYAHSFKTDDSDIIMARSKEGQKLRDFGYEFISGDDVSNGTTIASHHTINNNASIKYADDNRNDDKSNEYFNEHNDDHVINNKDDKNNNHNDGDHRHEEIDTNHSNAHHTNSFSSTIYNHCTKPAVLPKPSDRFLPTKRRGLNWIGLSSSDSKRNDNEKLMSKGSFKMIKQKISENIETNRMESESHRPILNRFCREKRDFPSFNHNENLIEPSQSASSFQSIQSSGRDESNNYSGANGDRKSSTGSASSYLSKLTFPTTKTPKEKRLLGSPRLHRALFGRRNIESPQIDHEIFSPVDSMLNKYSSSETTTIYNTHNATISPNATPTLPVQINGNDPKVNENNVNDSQTTNTAFNVMPSTCSSIPNANMDQNIEYPPVFEPETYSLCDPNASLKLIRRRTFNRNNNSNK